jgi:hypothetical protein
MTKEAIIELLDVKHQELLKWLNQQDQEKWTFGPHGKWTTAQQALHLLQSIKPLNDAMSMPKFLLRYKFGKTNRDVRAYATIVNRYKERLNDAKGQTFKGSRNMKSPTLNDKAYILNRIEVENKKLQHKVKTWKDKDLDAIVLPHPLMGKMPVREIVMWTSYHVEHHTQILKTNY